MQDVEAPEIMSLNEADLDVEELCCGIDCIPTKWL
jgi:hypothetical protein